MTHEETTLRESMSSNDEANEKVSRNVRDEFTRFRDEDYVLSVSANSFGAWIFRHVWIVPLLPFFMAIAITLLGWQLIDHDIAIHEVIQSTVDSELQESLWEPMSKGEWSLYNFTWSTSLVFTPVSLIGLVVALLFQRFTKSAPRVFIALVDAGRLNVGSSATATPRNHMTFAERIEETLHSPWRFVVCAFLIILSLSATVGFGRIAERWNDIQIDGLNARTSLDFLWSFTVTVLIPLLCAYFGAMGIWLVCTVAKYLRQLPRAFNLDIQPRHPDGCGGLKRVGDLCLEMAAMCIVPAVLVSFWILGGILAQATLNLTAVTHIAVATLLALTFLTFFAPMWTFHDYMAREKAAFQDKAIQEIAPVEKRLRELISQGKQEGPQEPTDYTVASSEDTRNNEIEKLKKQLELLHQLYLADLKYPVWPFDVNIFIKFFTPQIVPIFVLMGGLENKDTTLFSDIVNYIISLFGGS